MMSKYGSCSAHACTHCTYRPGHRFRCFDIMRAPPSPSTAVAWSRVEVHAALHGRTYMPGTGVRGRRVVELLPPRVPYVPPVPACIHSPDREVHVAAGSEWISPGPGLAAYPSSRLGDRTSIDDDVPVHRPAGTSSMQREAGGAGRYLRAYRTHTRNGRTRGSIGACSSKVVRQRTIRG